ncbi:MAG TPA: group III truncated hemoglobin [Rudaea sp.]|nr:group III truncated hemoglobin [Rudaea sp.]
MLANMGMLHSIENELTPDRIAVLVDTFYDRIQVHPVLGPIFNDVVSDWGAHKQRLTSFWCSVALGTRSYRGNPLAMHQPLPINAAHFRQWLALWQQTTRDVLGDEPGQHMLDYAQRIARGMQMGLNLLPRAQNDLGIPVYNVAPNPPDFAG